MSKQKFITLNEPVDRNALVQKLGNSLFLFIERENGQSTSVIKFSSDFEIEFFDELRLGIKRTYVAEDKIVLAGSLDGKHYVLAIDDNCRVLWTNPLDTNHIEGDLPAVSIDKNITLANYDPKGKINVVSIDLTTKEYFNQYSIKASPNQKVNVVGYGKELSAVWYENKKINSIDIMDNRLYQFDSEEVCKEFKEERPVRTAFCNKRQVYAWKDKESFWFQEGVEYSIKKKSIAPFGLGLIVPVSGPRKVAHLIDGQFAKSPNWGNMLYIEDHEPFYLDGFVYNVCQWNDSLVAIQKDKIWKFTLLNS